MFNRLVLLAASILFFASNIFNGRAQTSPSADGAEIKLRMNKLNVLGSVLYLAAHPDDENTRLIGYFSKGKLYRTGYLSLTRGDGGQNLVGNEQGELLGLIRTQELLAARRIDGGEQFFTRANDFGFTKNPEETFTFWNRDSILADVVFVIRTFQPDVIICRFPTTGEGGHGQHTASAILAQEAFTAAADPKRFPSQLKYVSVWQAKRLLWNTFNFGNTNTTSDDQFKMDVGVYNPLLGKGYSEIAAESRTMHKSQGFGSGKNRGSQLEYFKTMAGEAPSNDLMDGISPSWSRVAGSETIQAIVNKLIQDFKPEDPSASVTGLISLYDAIQNLPNSYWKTQKKKETEQLINLCSGLWFEAYSTQTMVSPGNVIEWKIQVINRSNIPITLKSVSIQKFDTTLNKDLANNQLISFQGKRLLEKSTDISEPYWLQRMHGLGEYKIPDLSMAGKPENDPPVIAAFHFIIGGRELYFTRPVVYKFTDPVMGEVYQPLQIAPPVMTTIEEPLYVFSSTESKEVKVAVKSAIDDARGFVSLKVPEGWQVSPSNNVFELKSKGDETTVTFSVSPSNSTISAAIDTMKAVVEMNGLRYDRGFLDIHYDYIPDITIYPFSQSKLVSVPLITKGKNIGYIKGAGDFIPEMLQQVGYSVTMLSDDEIANGNLSRYDAIITGVRLYNTNERMKFLNETLLNYVKNGGTMVVQYNTTADLVMENFGPYPFKITRDRVTDEHAAVNFLKPDAEILNMPNKITSQDFEGWIQERGLYLLSAVDSNYEKVFSMNDKGETALDGSLVTCNYGKGRYVYTGLSFFRELPAGVPGAYRLFVNLISR